MNSICRIRLSSLSHLKFKKGFLNAKFSPSLVSNGYMLKPICPIQIQFQSFWETFPSKARSLHAKDKLERKSHEVIYRAKIFNYAFYAQLGSIAACLTQVLYSSYYAYQSIFFNEAVFTPSHLGPFNFSHDLLSVMILLGFSFQFVFVYFLSMRPVLRVYYNSNADEYVFVTLSYNPFKSRLLHCKPGELLPLDVEKTLVFIGNHKLKGQKLFLKSTSFRAPYHYNRLTGYII